jgi:ribosome maturation protein SDO1
LSEVLQIEQVFTNVPKGQVSKREDWEKAFNVTDVNKVIEEVCRLDKTVSDKLDITEGRSTN